MEINELNSIIVTTKITTMTLNEYQQRAMETCMPSCSNIAYMLLNLTGEVGEFSSNVAKGIRKQEIAIGARNHPNQLLYADDTCSDTEIMSFNHNIMLEAGDIAWQLAGLCKVMGWTLEEVCQANLDKLASRKERGTIDGNGDFR